MSTRLPAFPVTLTVMALFLSRIPTATLRGNQHDSIRKNPLDTFSSRTRHHVHTSLYQCRYSTDSKSLISDCTSAANTARVQLVWLMSNDNKKPRAWACDSNPPPDSPRPLTHTLCRGRRSVETTVELVCCSLQAERSCRAHNQRPEKKKGGTNGQGMGTAKKERFVSHVKLMLFF